jgi:hypothetical protein
MTTNPFTIRIFVPDGDSQGIRIIDRMNWTGIAVVFPRSKWPETRSRKDFDKIGVYILSGYQGEDDDLPTLYIGQGDGLKDRIDVHYQNKDFWDTAIDFVSTSSGLNRAHVTWLEYALINRAESVKRCHLDNQNHPREPVLSESENADTELFLKEMLQILPLVGVQAFEFSKPVATPKAISADVGKPSATPSENDTIVVPAQEEGFQRVFIGEDCWYAIRISGGMLARIKYIVAYQTQPISAITHYAPVDRIEPFGDGGKYKVIFPEKANEISQIHFADAQTGSMQGPRYTNFECLKSAKKIGDLFVGN